MIRPVTLFLILLFAVSPLGATVHDDLAGIRKQIKEKRLLLKKSARVESQVSGEIVEIEKNLASRHDELKKLQGELVKVSGGIADCRKEAERVKKEVDARRVQIENRLRSLYKAGEIGTLRIFFSAESFPQMTENMRYTRSVLDNDRRLVEEYRRRLERLRELEEKLESERRRLDGINRQIVAKTREIEVEKEKKNQLLLKVRAEKKGYQASIRELQENARRLQAMIERLEAAGRKRYSTKPGDTGGKGDALPPVPDKGFGAQRGRLALPVSGTITTRYGRHKHPEFNSWTVSNGLSIAAPTGAPVHAVFEGKVIYSGYFRGYGNMMIIDHGGGYYSLYAHNSSLLRKEGSSVSRGEEIARVGDLDSTSGPKLYFEIRYQGRPVDPEAWVK